jgi:hypothetical protein
MSSFLAVVHDRRIDVPAPAELPDGTRVLIDITPLRDKIGLSELEWRDDAEAIADWKAWLKTIEPVPFSATDAFDEQFRQFNVEAVRKQMLGTGS